MGFARFTWREPDFARAKSVAAGASALAIFALTLLLTGWMLAQVAEHPGVPREVGDLPPWFMGESVLHGAREGSAARPAVAAPVAAEHGHEPGTAIAAIKPAAIAARKTDAADGDYVEFASGKVEIKFTEYEMTPSKVRTRPGIVTFMLRNEGRFAHNFHVEGPGVDAHADKFSPGRTVRLEVALQAGEYKISCPLSNHDQRGMHGTLIVTSKLAAN